jgi:beta-lactamase regulating signal transducer with metallopeptidase domain
MFNVEHSPFLHSLGYAIGHSLWQMSLLWLVYMAIINTRRWNSTQRYNLAVITAGTGFAWFIATIIYYSARVSPEYLPASEILPFKQNVISSENSLFFVYHSVLATLRSLSPYFSCAYLLVMMMLSIRLINGFNEVKQFRNKGISKSPVNWRLFVNDHAALLGIRKNVVVYLSNIATSPLTIGFIKPVILLPIASINNLTSEQVEAVLLHELAHIRRNDYFVNILMQVAEITLFFNPFMRLLLKQARIERENCCDDYVLQFRYNVADYAKALLSIQVHSAGNILALGASNNNEFQLLDRVKRMVAPQRKSFNYRQQLGMLFLLTLLGLGFTIISPKEKNIKKEPQNEVTRIGHPETSIYQNTLPVPFDLIKKIEAIGQGAEAVSGSLKKGKKQVNIQEQLKTINRHPHNPSSISEAADEMETGDEKNMVVTDENFVALNNRDWNELVKAGLMKDISPVFKDVTALIAPDIVFRDKDPQVFVNRPAPGVFYKFKGLKPNKEELVKIERKVIIEQRQLQALQRNHKRLEDSLQLVYKNVEEEAGLFEKAIAKANKEKAIAPFRVWDKHEWQNAVGTSYNFSFSNDENLEGPGPATPPAPPAARIANRNQGKKNCCKEMNLSHVTTVTVINGKQLAERVKKVWAEAQSGMKEGWTMEMQQKVVDEIEKELEGIQNIEIRTHTSPRSENNPRSFVIEVQGRP